MTWDAKPAGEVKVGDLVLANGYPAEVICAQFTYDRHSILIRWGEERGDWAAIPSVLPILMIPGAGLAIEDPWSPDGSAETALASLAKPGLAASSLERFEITRRKMLAQFDELARVGRVERTALADEIEATANALQQLLDLRQPPTGDASK